MKKQGKQKKEEEHKRGSRDPIPFYGDMEKED